MIKSIKLSKFNGVLCENLYSDVRYITKENLDDITKLYNTVSSSMDNKNWLRFRNKSDLESILDNGGFIIGCYIEDILIASAMCEIPQNDYKDVLLELGMTEDDVNNHTYVSGYVMVDPLYRGNSLHHVLLNTRMTLSALSNKKYILTAVATENIYSLKTILGLGFEIKAEKTSELGISRYLLLRELSDIIEITA